MRKRLIIYIIVFLSPTILIGQDASFSQFDMNMNYTNPAFSGYEGGDKFILNYRDQWNRINENFHNSIFEFNSMITLNKNSRKYKANWGFGISIISQDLMAIPGTGNKVFLNKFDIIANPFTWHQQLSKNWWISAAPIAINFKKYSLNSDNLIFSDMIDDFGRTFNISSFDPEIYVHNNWISDLSAGILLTRNGEYQANKNNRINLGISIHKILKQVEALSGLSINDNIISTRQPIKFILHSEYFSSVPAWKRPFISYFRIVAKYESYLNMKNIISKTEIGGSSYLNNTPIEIGSFIRLLKNQPFHRQTWVSLLRIRKSIGNHLYVFSYSYDANISTSNQQLLFNDVGTTHEFGIGIFLFGGRAKGKSCAAFGKMENNALYNDIMKNGMLNNRKTKRNFR